MSINNIKNFVYYLIWIKNSISLIENTKISRIFSENILSKNITIIKKKKL